MTGATVDRILNATAELINERGLPPLTVTAVAKRAGVSRQTLYLHYGDVDEIIIDLLARHSADVMGQLDQLLGVVSGASAKLEQLIRQTVSAGADHDPASLARALGSEARRALETHLSRRRAVIRELLKEGIDSGEFRPELPVGGAAAIIDAQLGSVGAMVASGLSLAEAADALTEFALRAIRIG